MIYIYIYTQCVSLHVSVKILAPEHEPTTQILLMDWVQLFLGVWNGLGYSSPAVSTSPELPQLGVATMHPFLGNCLLLMNPFVLFSVPVLIEIIPNGKNINDPPLRAIACNPPGFVHSHGTYNHHPHFAIGKPPLFLGGLHH